MITTITPLRRVAVTLAMAGIAVIGGVAPSASAADNSDNGPFLMEMEHGVLPVFECDPTKPNQRHNNCIDVTGATRF